VWSRVGCLPGAGPFVFECGGLREKRCEQARNGKEEVDDEEGIEAWASSPELRDKKA
jgi:hypothetical protein